MTRNGEAEEWWSGYVRAYARDLSGEIFNFAFYCSRRSTAKCHTYIYIYILFYIYI